MSALDQSWVDAEARRLAPLLEGEHAVVISGPDVVAAAAVALALAQVHGTTRRVAVADLVGDVAPLLAAVNAGPDDDPHGIADSFLYGVSLNKIARPIDASGSVFVMPSGTEPVALEAVYRNDRWRRLAAGFQQVGALLLLVAVRDVPGFDALCQYVGALLPVGERTAPVLSDVRVLWIAPPPPPVDEVRKVERAKTVAEEDAGQRRSRLFATLAVIAAMVLAGLWAWPALQARFLSAPVAPEADTLALSEAGRDTPTPGPDPASVAADTVPVADAPALSAFDTGPAQTRTGPLVVANPEDSARSAQFAVYFVNANTLEQAQPPATVEQLGAVAISPVLDGSNNARWFRVTVGAGTDSAQAVALLTRLREAGEVGPNSGSIMRLPYGFRLERGLTMDVVPTSLARWSQRGIRAYALRQTDGMVTLYTGAFRTPAQATLLADSLQQAGIPPTLVYRTGRTF